MAENNSMLSSALAGELILRYWWVAALAAGAYFLLRPQEDEAWRNPKCQRNPKRVKDTAGRRSKRAKSKAQSSAAAKTNPWRSVDVKRHHKRCAAHKRCSHLWTEVANRELDKHGDDGRAIRVANHVANKWLKAKGYGDPPAPRKRRDKNSAVSERNARTKQPLL